MDLPVRVNICVCHNSSAEVPEAIENEEQVKGLYSSRKEIVVSTLDGDV